MKFKILRIQKIIMNIWKIHKTWRIEFRCIIIQKKFSIKTWTDFPLSPWSHWWVFSIQIRLGRNWYLYYHLRPYLPESRRKCEISDRIKTKPRENRESIWNRPEYISSWKIKVFNSNIKPSISNSAPAGIAVKIRVRKLENLNL